MREGQLASIIKAFSLNFSSHRSMYQDNIWVAVWQEVPGNSADEGDPLFGVGAW